MPNRNIVLFLGAGFSREAGLPVMSGFGSASEQELQRLQGHVPGEGEAGDRKAAPLFIDAGDVFEGLRRLLRERNKTVAIKDGNMEAVYCVAESMAESGVKRVQIDGKTVCMAALMSRIQLWLWKIYQRCPPRTDAVNGSAKSYRDVFAERYRPFFEAVAKQAARIAVLTTNYDLMFEYGMFVYATDKCCSYPIEIGNDSRLVSKGEHKNYVTGREDSRHPVVCKLHGSVNLFHDPAKGDEWVGVSSSARGGRPAIFAVDELNDLRLRYGDSLVPAIVPPTYAKLRGYGWLRRVWQEARLALANAKLVVFVGYSMPESDGFMRAMVQAAMSLRPPSDLPKVIVCDRSVEVLGRYREFFAPLGDLIETRESSFGNQAGNWDSIFSL